MPKNEQLYINQFKLIKERFKETNPCITCIVRGACIASTYKNDTWYKNFKNDEKVNCKEKIKWSNIVMNNLPSREEVLIYKGEF